MIINIKLDGRDQILVALLKEDLEELQSTDDKLYNKKLMKAIKKILKFYGV